MMRVPAPRCRIFGLPFDPRAAWTVDACLLPPASASCTTPAAAGGSDGATSSSGAAPTSSGVLFLDIVQQEDWSGDPADRERFMKWGYRWAPRPALSCGLQLLCLHVCSACNPPCDGAQLTVGCSQTST